MNSGKLHLHSMMVHAVIALAVVAAGAFVLAARQITIGGVGPEVWTFLLNGGLIGVAVIALPSTLTGITERNHMYATWHRTHRIKLVLSFLLLASSAAAWIEAADTPRLEPWPIALVASVPILALALAAYGLRITLGRVSLARLSYLPDMRRTPPVDILRTAAEHAAEDPKLTDPREEMIA